MLEQVRGTNRRGRGTTKMLHDDALWQALTPLIEAMKAFSAGLARDVDKPISAFTGKAGSA